MGKKCQLSSKKGDFEQEGGQQKEKHWNMAMEYLELIEKSTCDWGPSEGGSRLWGGAGCSCPSRRCQKRTRYLFSFCFITLPRKKQRVRQWNPQRKLEKHLFSPNHENKNYQMKTDLFLLPASWTSRIYQTLSKRVAFPRLLLVLFTTKD